MVAACWLIALVWAVPLAAQDVTTEQAPEDRWTFTLTPYLWMISLKGDARVGGADVDVDVPFSDSLKDLSFGGMLYLGARKGRFGVSVNGLFTRVEPDDQVGPLDLDATSDLAQLAATPFYRLVQWHYGETGSGRPLNLVVEPYAGLRLNHLRVQLDLKTSGPGGGRSRTVDDHETWVDPIVGTRFGIDLSDRFALGGAADIGGVVAGSDLSWNIQGYLGYRTSVLGQPTTLALGYRVLHVDYDHNDFQWDVTQHGPIIGAALRF